MKNRQDDRHSDSELIPTQNEREAGKPNYVPIALTLFIGLVAGTIFYAESKARDFEANGLIFSARVVRDQVYTSLTIGIFLAIFGFAIIAFVRNGMNKK